MSNTEQSILEVYDSREEKNWFGSPLFILTALCSAIIFKKTLDYIIFLSSGYFIPLIQIKLTNASALANGFLLLLIMFIWALNAFRLAFEIIFLEKDVGFRIVKAHIKGWKKHFESWARVFLAILIYVQFTLVQRVSHRCVLGENADLSCFKNGDPNSIMDSFACINITHILPEDSHSMGIVFILFGLSFLLCVAWDHVVRNKDTKAIIDAKIKVATQKVAANPGHSDNERTNMAINKTNDFIHMTKLWIREDYFILVTSINLCLIWYQKPDAYDWLVYLGIAFIAIGNFFAGRDLYRFWRNKYV